MRTVWAPPAGLDWRPLRLSDALGDWQGRTGLLDGTASETALGEGHALTIPISVGIGEDGDTPNEGMYRLWKPRRSDGALLSAADGLAFYMLAEVDSAAADPWALVGLADTGGDLTDAGALALGGGHRVELALGRRLVSVTRSTQSSSGTSADTALVAVIRPGGATGSLGTVQSYMMNGAGVVDATNTRSALSAPSGALRVWLAVGGRTVAAAASITVAAWYAPLRLPSGGFPVAA